MLELHILVCFPLLFSMLRFLFVAGLSAFLAYVNTRPDKLLMLD